MGVGHHYCPLRRSILQPRDVNAIEQLRTAREATTIDSCGYRCAGGQCAQPGTAYRRSPPDCGLLLKLESFSKFGRLLGESLVCTSSAAARSVLCRLRWGFFISRQQRDKTIQLPHLDIVAGYSSQRLLDGFVIVHALDIFRVDSVTVIVNGVHAIFRHDLLPKL